MKQNVSLADLTTLQVGGTGDWLIRVSAAEELAAAYEWAAENRLPVLLIGEGSNILFSDRGYRGLLVLNQIRGLSRDGLEVEVDGGWNLGALIRWLNEHQLAGLERMYGIPGTVAGAIVGNAGAYGQEIKDSIVWVEAWSAERGLFKLSALEAGFDYRHSIFKERRDLVVVRCRLRLRPSSEDLQVVSDEILFRRLEKYPVGLMCPGSFFKNIVAARLEPEILQGIPRDFIMYGKIPAGKLLEEVGARGARRGECQFADYHGNLIVNLGRASSDDILELASEYARRVRDRFGVRLEPEILIVDDREWPELQVQPASWSTAPQP